MIMCGELLEKYKGAIQDRCSSSEEGFNVQLTEVPRNYFNETKGRDLVGRVSKNEESTVLQKYVALSCVSAVNTFLDATTGETLE